MNHIHSTGDGSKVANSLGNQHEADKWHSMRMVAICCQTIRGPHCFYKLKRCDTMILRLNNNWVGLCIVSHWFVPVSTGYLLIHAIQYFSSHRHRRWPTSSPAAYYTRPVRLTTWPPWQSGQRNAPASGRKLREGHDRRKNRIAAHRVDSASSPYTAVGLPTTSHCHRMALNTISCIILNHARQ